MVSLQEFEHYLAGKSEGGISPDVLFTEIELRLEQAEKLRTLNTIQIPPQPQREDIPKA